MGRIEEEFNLVSRAVSGEPLALERLLLDHHRDLLQRIQDRVPASLRSTFSAEDLLQETFADVFRDIRQFRPGGAGSFSRWLETIADHRVLDAIRANRADKRGGGRAPVEASPRVDDSAVFTLLDIVAVHERTPSRSAAGHEAIAAVQAAIGRLKPDYRDAIRMRYIEGLSVAETAAQMDRTERAVHKLCSRGLQKLRESLGEASKFLSRK